MPGTNLRDAGRHRSPPGRHVVLNRPGPHDGRSVRTQATTGSTTTIRRPAPRRRRDVRPDLVDATVHDHAQRSLDRPGGRRAPDSRIALTDLAADNEPGGARGLRTPHGRGLHRPVDPPTTGSTPHRSSRCRTPAAPTRPSTARAPSAFHGHRPEAGRSCRTPRRLSLSPPATARLCGASLLTKPLSTYGPRSSPVSTTRCSTFYHGKIAADIPLPLLPPVARQAPRRRRAREGHRAGRASATSRTRLDYPTSSASTTSSTCRSTTWARWRTPAASRSATRYLRAAARTARSTSSATGHPHEMAHSQFGVLVRLMVVGRPQWLQQVASPVGLPPSGDQFTESWTSCQRRPQNWAYRQDQLEHHPCTASTTSTPARGRGQPTASPTPGTPRCSNVAWRGSSARFQLPRGIRGCLGTSRVLQRKGSPTCLAAGASGRDLDSWGQEWLQTRASTRWPPSSSSPRTAPPVSFGVRQTAPRPPGRSRRHRLRHRLYDALNGRPPGPPHVSPRPT